MGHESRKTVERRMRASASNGLQDDETSSAGGRVAATAQRTAGSPNQAARRVPPTGCPALSTRARAVASLATGTARAAECLGFGKETGALEADKATDLLVLDRDPLRDITVASDATARALVLRAGRPVGGTRRAAWLGQTAFF